MVAIDGSLLNLPHTEDIENEFGGVSNQHEKVISARCSFAYDVCNQLVLDAAIAPRRSCEKDLAVGHLDSLNPDTDILVFDRGYPCQWLMSLLDRQGYRFCFRLSTAWRKAHALMEHATDIDWTMVRGTDREWGKLRDYNLSKTLTGLRLISIPLSSGEKEVLVTNISRDSCHIKDIKTLYHLRWGVEEGYKTFKKTLHVEHFSGRSSQSVKQDFHARVFMLNMSAMIRSQGVDSQIKNAESNKHYQKANKTQALAKVKDFLTDIFYSNKVKKVINQLLNILVKRTDIERLGRSFERPKTSTRRRSKIINYKGI